MEKIIDNKYFVAGKQDKLAIVRIKSDVFELITSLDDSQNLTEFIRETEYDKDIKGLLLLSEPYCLGEEAYDQYLQRIMTQVTDGDGRTVTSFSERNTRFREINILNKFIKFLANYQKLYISGFDCNLSTPFVGVVLVADITIISPKTYLSFSHIKHRLHPSGGLPFILKHYLGYAKAMEVMLSPGITAEEALNLGLVNYILPQDNFEQHCISKIKPAINTNYATLRATKRLANFNNKLLEDYFEYETSLLNL